MANDETRLTLRLPSDLMARVKTLAESERRSVNAQLVTLIEAGLALRSPPGSKKGSR